METVKETKKTGDKTSHWKLEAYGRAMECDGEITEMIENKRIAWSLESTPDGTKVTHVIDYELPGVMGAIIDKIKVSKEMEKSLEEK